MTHFLDIHKTDPADLRSILNHALDMKSARAGRPKGAPDDTQPLDDRMRWFVVPRLEFQQDFANVLIANSVKAEVDSHYFRASAFGGRMLGNWGEIRVGYSWADGSVDGLEAQTVRRIGALLEVPDAAIGEARKRAGRAPRAPRD